MSDDSESDSDAPIVRPSTAARRPRTRPAADDDDAQSSSSASTASSDQQDTDDDGSTDDESTVSSHTDSDAEHDSSSEASDVDESSPVKPPTAKRSRHVRRLESTSSSSSAAGAAPTEPIAGPSRGHRATTTSTSGSDIRRVAKRPAAAPRRGPAIVYDDSSESSDSSWSPLDDRSTAAHDPQQPSTSAAARRQDALAAAAAAAATQAAAADRVEPTAEEQSAASASSSSDDNDDDANPNRRDKCPICLHSFRSQPLGRPTSCEHAFCLCCIEEWSRNVQTCPIDRLPFSAIGRYERGRLVGEIAVEARTTELDVGDADDVTACEVCRATDREDTMLLCDGCNRGYHMDCLHPALEAIPANAWYCDYCFDSEAEEAEEDAAAIGELLSEMRELGEPATRLRVRPAPAVAPAAAPRITRTRQSERIRATILSRIAPSRRHAPVGVRESALGMPLPGELQHCATDAMTKNTPPY